MAECITRICTRCDGEFPATIEYFSKSKLGKYGLCSGCKKCLALYRKEYRAKN